MPNQDVQDPQEPQKLTIYVVGPDEQLPPPDPAALVPLPSVEGELTELPTARPRAAAKKVRKPKERPPLDPAALKVMPLYKISGIIRVRWTPIHQHAQPYVAALERISTLGDKYGADQGVAIVEYFLVNAVTWKGPYARQIKAELSRRVKLYRSGKDA